MSTRKPTVYGDLNTARNLLHGSGVSRSKQSIVASLMRIDQRLYDEFWRPGPPDFRPSDEVYERIAERLQTADKDALIDALRAERDDFAKTAQDYENLCKELLGVLLSADQVKFIVNLVDAQIEFAAGLGRAPTDKLITLKRRLLDQVGL